MRHFVSTLKGSAFRLCAVPAFAVVIFACVYGTARAEVEYCPANVSMVRVGVADGKPSTMYSVLLSGASARVVSGDITMRASDGNWFAAHFSSVPLTAYKEQWDDVSATFFRVNYVSPVLYVRFPQAVSIASDFVSDAEATNETVFGWNAKGSIVCPGRGEPAKVTGKPDLTLTNPVPGAQAPPKADSQILAASIASAPGATDCDVPFQDVQTLRVTQPAYPRDQGAGDAYPIHTSLIKVAVNAQGGIDDAWIWGPSGNRYFDDSALQAARSSTYQPARAFCQNVPGVYLFHADFER